MLAKLQGMLFASTNKSITCFLKFPGAIVMLWFWQLVLATGDHMIKVQLLAAVGHRIWGFDIGHVAYVLCPYSREFYYHTLMIHHSTVCVLLYGFKCWFPHSTMFGEQTQVAWVQRVFSCQAWSTDVSETLQCLCMPMVRLDRVWQILSLRMVISHCLPESLQAWWL